VYIKGGVVMIFVGLKPFNNVSAKNIKSDSELLIEAFKALKKENNKKRVLIANNLLEVK